MTALWFLVPAFAGWQEDSDAGWSACASAPTPACAVVETLHIRESRAGIWFVQDDRLEVEHLPLLLGRLQQPGEPALRVALATGAVQLLTDADPSWHGAWADLAASEPDAQVRSVFITGLRRAPMTAAGPGLRGALSHADPVTRRDAAAVMGGHAEAPAFVDDLVAALGETEPAARRAIIRALGHAGDVRAVAPLRALLAADAADREEITRALGRLER